MRVTDTMSFLLEVKARGLNNPNYDFSKFEYKHSKKKAIIVCRAHGEFLIRPSEFLSGNGCAKCANDRISAFKTSSTEEFLLEVKVRGLDKPQYDFSKFEYTHSHQKAVIICRVHGDFLIAPRNFLAGSGCAKCTKNPHDRSKKTFVYILTDDEDQKTKIGVSCNLESRILKLKRKTPFKFSLFETFEFDNFDEAFAFEQCVHKILKENLCEFEETFQGHTEWFNITGENAVSLINSILPDFYIETLD